MDGGIRVELIEFLRLFFMCRRVARDIAMDIIGGPFDQLCRVPRPLLDAINAAAADLSDDSAAISSGCLPADAGSDDVAADSAGADDGEQSKAHGEARGVESWASDGAGSDCGEVNTEKADLADGLDSSSPYQLPIRSWDDGAPPLSFAEQFSEHALADTGVVGGAARQDALLPLRAGTPGTVASALKVVDFERAVAVGPFTVWAPSDDWTAFDAVFDCVMDGEFTADNLLKALGRADVTDLRLLQGAVPCLAPALCADPVKRHILAELLLSFVETRGDYDDFVADAQVSEDNELMETHTAT